MDEEGAKKWLAAMFRCLSEGGSTNKISDCYFEGRPDAVDRVDIRNLEFRVRGKMLFVCGRKADDVAT